MEEKSSFLQRTPRGVRPVRYKPKKEGARPMQDGEPLAPRPVSTRVHHYPATTRRDPPCSDLYLDSDHHDVVPERIRRGPDVCQCRWLPLPAHAELSRDAGELGVQFSAQSFYSLNGSFFGFILRLDLIDHGGPILKHFPEIPIDEPT